MRSLFNTPRSRFLKNPDRAQTILIVDVNNFVHRMIHAYSSLETSEGVPSGHVYGTLSNMKFLASQVKGRMCVVFVSDGEPLHRLKVYPDYKKPRRIQKDEEKAQLVFEATRVLHMFPGVIAFNGDEEADDVMASVAREFLRRGRKVYVCSNDRDLWQLSAVGAKILTSSREGGALDIKAVEKKLGFHPLYLRLNKAMYGDSSDFIKGVPRLQKKVFGMLNAMTLQGLKEQLKDLPSAHKKRIEEHWQIVERNWDLVELRTVNYTLHQCGDIEALLGFAQLFQCKSLFSWIEGLEA